MRRPARTTRCALTSAVAIAMLWAQSRPARADVYAIAGMGDSLTEEYFEDPDYAYAANWVEQLVVYRGLNFGPTAAEAGQPGGTWGEPRRTGYEFNWARAGDMSTDLLEHGQHTGVAGLVHERGITHAVLIIGSNDFAPMPLPGFPYYYIYNGLWSEAQIQAYVELVVSSIEEAAAVVDATGTSLVMSNVVDYGVALLTRLLFPDPAKRDLVSAVIEQVNDDLDAVAQQHHIVLVDLNGVARTVFGPNSDPNEVLLLGNVLIYLNEADTIYNENPQAAFVHDGIHPHTHLHGAMANVLLEGLNIGYGAGVPLFTEEELLAHAGLSYGGLDTLVYQIGPYADFVHDYTLIDGDLDEDLDVDLDDYGMLLEAMAGPEVHEAPAGCPPEVFIRADLTGDYDVDLRDAVAFITRFGGSM